MRLPALSTPFSTTLGRRAASLGSAKIDLALGEPPLYESEIPGLRADRERDIRLRKPAVDANIEGLDGHRDPVAANLALATVSSPMSKRERLGLDLRRDAKKACIGRNMESAADVGVAGEVHLLDPDLADLARVDILEVDGPEPVAAARSPSVVGPYKA